MMLKEAYMNPKQMKILQNEMEQKDNKMKLNWSR